MTGSGLTEVAVYRRRVGASLERVWENVLDWEHLPWLHSSSFASIESLAVRPDGWCARVGLVSVEGTQLANIDLRTERERDRYVAATIDGVGVGSEIWTELAVAGPHETDIQVSFRVPDVPASAVDLVGGYYRDLYRQLWDEDEGMMQHREAMLGLLSGNRGTVDRIDLGPRDEVWAKLPLVIDGGGRRYRVAAVDGEILAHSAICPHLLGPLESCGSNAARVRCPWHGYEFDIRSGKSCDGRNLRLGTVPKVQVSDGRVILTIDGPGESGSGASNLTR